MKEKNRFHHGDLKNEIIKQGLKIVYDKGFQSVELKDISQACHVSTPSIYKQFDGSITYRSRRYFLCFFRERVSLFL